MAIPEINVDKLISFLSVLINTPSPTGFTESAIAVIEEQLSLFTGLELKRNNKGALIAKWDGKDDNPARALTAHVDTLGAMVKEIKPNGRLILTKIGGFAWNSVEGEGCTVFTKQENSVRGSLLPITASSHVHGDKVSKLKRYDKNMEVRLDIHSLTEEETRQCGIEVGDFVAFDPRLEITNGFIRSRHLDDKASVACLMAAIEAMHVAGLVPTRDTIFHFSNFEEVGHGASTGIPPNVNELVSVDMAAIGEGQQSDEFHATLCVKDSGGPYHYKLSRHLQDIANVYQIPYKLDVYPYYGSDGEAFWRAGGDVAVALIGPGVDASHNYERTHLDALVATTKWIIAYLMSTST